MMNTPSTIPSVQTLKAQARRLRDDLGQRGHAVCHGEALEMIARQLGYRDWNTLHAAAGNGENQPFLTVGERVSGHYLGQAFAGEIIGVVQQQASGRYRVTVHFDEPVDVVRFDSFSAFRRRVSCTLDRTYRTVEKTGNGQPQMILAR